MDDNNQNIRWELLTKEMDIIEDTVKNLDSIIYKTKYFAFTAWGGGLYLIAQHLADLKDQHDWLYLGTAIIPILFWIMDARWQKPILTCIERKKNIAKFINSSDFECITTEDMMHDKKEIFPLYDPIGWIYTINKGIKQPIAEGFPTKYLTDKSKSSWRKAMCHKGTWLFYGTMILLSVIISIFSYRYILSEASKLM